MPDLLRCTLLAVRLQDRDHTFHVSAWGVFFFPLKNKICPHRVTRYDCRETGRRGRLGNPVRVRSRYPAAVFVEACCSWREPVIGKPLRRRNSRQWRIFPSGTARARIPTMLADLWDVPAMERVTGKSLGSVNIRSLHAFFEAAVFLHRKEVLPPAKFVTNILQVTALSCNNC